MPAAAVIPASVVYIKVVAVKKLVVGFLDSWNEPAPQGDLCLFPGEFIQFLANIAALYWVAILSQIVYFEKIRVFKAGLCREYISME